MKKVVALLLALLTAFGVSTAAFAAVDDIASFSDSGQYYISERSGWGLSGDDISVTANELILVDENNRVVGPEYHLEPGEEYTFKIYVADRAYASEAPGDITDKTQVTDYMLGGGKFRIRGVKGTSTISSAKVEKKGGGNTATFNLVINVRDNWGTKLTDVEYNLSVTGQTESHAATLEQGNILFKVGYDQFTDDDIDSYSEGDIITISNDQPVILKKQFTTLAKNYNYKNIEFEAEDGSWRYIGKVSGMGDTNFTYSQDVIPAIVTRFEDQDFKFLTFGAGVNFPTNGEMRIDVSDVSDDYTEMYTYLYRNGTLTPISTTYDSGADEIVFRTNYLGSFVMTNEKITDTTIIDQGNNNNSAEEVNPDDNNAGENPNTGAGHGVEMAVTLGVVSLAAAATVGRRKKK